MVGLLQDNTECYHQLSSGQSRCSSALCNPHLQYTGCPRPQDTRLRGPNACHLCSLEVQHLFSFVCLRRSHEGETVYESQTKERQLNSGAISSQLQRSQYLSQTFGALVFIQNLRQTLTQINDCPDKTLWDTKLLFIIIVQVCFSN